jgi:hypothetical protein
MRESAEKYRKPCKCRSVGECLHNLNAETKALDALVRHFTRAMRVRLREQWRAGRSGWDDPKWTTEQIIERMVECAKRGDAVDAANFAAFLWNRQGG